MQGIDLLITPKWIIPIAPDERVLEGHSLAVNRGQIIDLDKSESISSRYTATTSLVLDQSVLLPGLINSHTHSAMTLFRGYADDLPLMEWLSEHIWPAEQKWVDESFIETGTDLACAEMIQGGTTCFNDMYFFPDIVARQTEQAGMRACVGMLVIDFPTIWARDTDEYLSKGLAVRDDIRHSNLITAAFSPHSPYTVSDEPLRRIVTLSEELDCQIQMHVHETAREVSESMAIYGVRPLERLDQLGLLGPRLMAVHMTQLLNGEIETLAERGVHIVHCPESNLKLASGFCPVNDLIGAGVNLAIGTDGSSSNNDLDMLSEVRSASLLAKGVSNDPTALDAWSALKAATLNGAKALGIDHLVGSIEVGKQADFITLDLSDCSTQPVFNPVSQVVYSAVRSQVSNVWINGERVLDNHELTTIDKDRVCHSARQWRDKMVSRSI